MIYSDIVRIHVENFVNVYVDSFSLIKHLIE